MKRLSAAALVLPLVFTLASCAVQDIADESVNIDEKYFTFTARDLDASYNERNAEKITFSDTEIIADGNGAEIDGNAVTIKKDGVYILSGSSKNASVTVDISKEKKLQLVLDGLSLNANDSPAIYIKSADKVFVTLADGTENSLTDGAAYTATDGETTLDAALFSKEDITVNGTGNLTVTGNTAHGIVSKDDLVITGGTIEITAVKKALSGKDSVKIGGGELTLTSGTDGIHAENADEAVLGVVYIADGKLDITATEDGIQSQSKLKIDGGEIKINCGDDGIHSDGDVEINGGDITVENCLEGIEGASINITDGNICVKSDDDGMNATGTQSGDQPFSRGEIPQMPDGEMPQMPDGEVPQGEMPRGEMPRGEMPHGEMPEPPDGYREDSPDMNGDLPANTVSTRGGFMGGDFRGEAGKGGSLATDAEINISGGYVYIDAGGDGIDSNGAFTLSGGVVLISGSELDDNSALDYETSAKVTGGTLVALGSSGMSEGFTEAVGQGAIMFNIPTQSANTSFAIYDSNGDVALSFSPSKKYSNVVATSPLLKVGESYTVTAGAAVTDADENGFAQSGRANGGAILMQFELTAELYNASRGKR